MGLRSLTTVKQGFRYIFDRWGTDFPWQGGGDSAFFCGWEGVDFLSWAQTLCGGGGEGGIFVGLVHIFMGRNWTLKTCSPIPSRKYITDLQYTSFSV